MPASGFQTAPSAVAAKQARRQQPRGHTVSVGERIEKFPDRAAKPTWIHTGTDLRVLERRPTRS